MRVEKIESLILNPKRTPGENMDKNIKTNRERWNALANANVEWSRPFLDYMPEKAAAYIGRYGIIKDVAGKKVLCLASGGGQDSAAFGILNAKVTVMDLSDVQLERDHQAAAHHGYPVETSKAICVLYRISQRISSMSYGSPIQ